jgi:hypothetical protein
MNQDQSKTDGAAPVSSTPLLCRVGWHKWEHWRTLESRAFGHAFWRILQERKCPHCGRHELREQIV